MLFVSGTGKSLIIKAITSSIQDKLGSNAFVLLASTGIAALNIGGQTVHSYFNIPRDKKNFNDLVGEQARNFTNKISAVKFVLIDEYSTIGCSLLGMIEKRCSQGKEWNTEPFGGLNFFLFGDIDQLPPVKDLPVYHPKPQTPLAQHGKLVFGQFQKCIFLHQCHRQKDETFRVLLDNISSGDFSETDFKLLSTRFVTSVPKNELFQLSEVLHLFSTISEVNAFNLSMLEAATNKDSGHSQPVARVPAIHNCKLASSAKPEDCDGFESVLYLCQGCRVMLRHNLWTSKGLVHGAVGIVVDIVYETGLSSPSDLPAVILCSFPSYIGPLIEDQNVVPICSMTSKWTTKTGITCTRKQFPLSVAYACSIHKSQGMTLDKVIYKIQTFFLNFLLKLYLRFISFNYNIGIHSIRLTILTQTFY